MRGLLLAGLLGLGCGSDSGAAPASAAESSAWLLSAGTAHTCAVHDGGVWCWGRDTAGQLGDGALTSCPVPKHVEIAPVVNVQAGAAHTCALLADHSVSCWGKNDHGQLGGDGLADVDQLASGWWHACALRSGEVWCWGWRNDQGGLLSNHTENAPTPWLVPGLPPIASIATGFQHSCALDLDGGVWCWGGNGGGQLGDGTKLTRLAPIRVAGMGPAAKLGLGGGYSCAVLEDGELWCWGINTHGELGIGSAAFRSLVPVRVLDGVSLLATGGASACARTGAGLLCWGDNAEGELGDGTLVSRTAPEAGLTLALGALALSKDSAGGHGCGAVGEKVYYWGRDADGETASDTMLTDANPKEVRLR